MLFFARQSAERFGHAESKEQPAEGNAYQRTWSQPLLVRALFLYRSEHKYGTRARRSVRSRFGSALGKIHDERRYSQEESAERTRSQLRGVHSSAEPDRASWQGSAFAWKCPPRRSVN
jgi:hypothetical protein